MTVNYLDFCRTGCVCLPTYARNDLGDSIPISQCFTSGSNEHKVDHYCECEEDEFFGDVCTCTLQPIRKEKTEWPSICWFAFKMLDEKYQNMPSPWYIIWSSQTPHVSYFKYAFNIIFCLWKSHIFNCIMLIAWHI